MDFSYALKALKEGLRVWRVGWNGKGMFVYLVPEGGHKFVYLKNGEGLSGPALEHLPYIAMKTADNKIVPWLASQTDILAEDWKTT